MLAVAAGSSLRGLRGDFPVVLRSPQHYGFGSSQPLRHGFDPECIGTWNDFDVQMPVTRTASWVISKVCLPTFGEQPALLAKTLTNGRVRVANISRDTPVFRISPGVTKMMVSR